MSRSRIRLGVILSAWITCTGCAHDNDWSVARMIGWDEVKTPSNVKLPPAQLQTAERVETVGRKIITQNTFTGIEPLFHTVGVPESVLFHRGPEELFISEGLVSKCKTDQELAAVLCSELAKMVTEKKSARRVGADRDSFPEVGLSTGNAIGSAGGTAADPARAAEIAYQERRAKPSVEPVDAKLTARNLLRDAGYDPAELDRVEDLLKQSDRGGVLSKQMSGSGAAPRWDR